MDDKSHYSEVSYENEEYVIRNLFIFQCFIEVELANNEIGYLAEISKQNLRVTWFLLTAYNKMQEEKGESKMELLSKKELNLKDLENSLPNHIAEK